MSAGLAAALRGALALGNFLNWGGRLGAAPGFRLRNLPKLKVSSLCSALLPFPNLFLCLLSCFCPTQPSGSPDSSSRR